MNILRIIAIILALASASAGATAATNECGGNAAIVGNGYVITASGGDDTDTIQCALDSAVLQGLGSVRLNDGSYRVTGLKTTGFVGNFEGTTRAGTEILIENFSSICGDDFDDAKAIISFAGGSITVRYMTLDVDTPCDRGSSYTVLEFTQESCEVRTHFAVVDRVDFRGSRSSDISRAIKNNGNADCVAQGLGPLGTFKLNRSTIDTFTEGVKTGLLGGGQVDINFNEFTDTNYAITIFDANQNTTITGNTIDYLFRGVLVGITRDGAPAENRTVVHNNTFSQISSDGGYHYAIQMANYLVRASNSVVVTKNRINLVDSADETIGVVINETDGALIANNTLKGSARVGIFVGGTNFSANTKDTIITGNSFQQNNSFENASGKGVDVYLAEGTEATIVGPQSAVTDNRGTGNRVL